MQPETAFIYRRGLTKADIGKDTFNLKVTNTVTLGSSEQQVLGKGSSGTEVPCMSSLLSDLVDLKRLKLQGDDQMKEYSESLDHGLTDKYSVVREKLSKAMSKDCRRDILHVVKGEKSQDGFLVRSNALIQGRFSSVDTTILADKGSYFQYLRVKNTEAMVFDCS